MVGIITETIIISEIFVILTIISTWICLLYCKKVPLILVSQAAITLLYVMLGQIGVLAQDKIRDANDNRTHVKRNFVLKVKQAEVRLPNRLIKYGLHGKQLISSIYKRWIIVFLLLHHHNGGNNLAVISPVIYTCNVYLTHFCVTACHH